MASDILKKLEAYPNEEFLSASQGEALRWMMDLNVAHMLPSDSATKPFIGVSDGCKTHWVTVRVVRGDAGPGADGIYVSCIPRSAIKGEDLKALIMQTYGGKVLSDREER
jgi:hypothetical protein